MIMTIDIGGTKTLCSWWDNGKLQKKEQHPTSSIKNFTRFIMQQAQLLPIDTLCMAMAGPVTGSRLELTNTGQILYLDQIKTCISHIPRVLFLNDLEALGHALNHLQTDQLQIFRKARNESPSSGTQTVLSIGTGLGLCTVTKEGLVFPSEGGHTDFAPCDPQQQQVLDHLKNKYSHVSYERVLSGQGLVNLYEVFAGEPLPAPDQVTARAFAGETEALKTFRVFTRILAAACSNAALTFMASGGIYLAGGIIPKILPLLDRSTFEEAFLQKGRFSQWLQQIPVYVILDEMAPSMGAALAGSAQCI